MVSHLFSTIALLVALGLQPVMATPPAKKTVTPDDGKQEAERLWELAIAAKGGRERLYAVRNMVISRRAEYTTHLFKKNQVHQEGLYVFPNKYWFWNDLRPDVFGLNVKMYNFDSNMCYSITPENPHQPPEPITRTPSDKTLADVQLSYLLETRWFKPVLVKASSGRVGLQKVDIVETRVNDYRVDFAFDRRTHLPIRKSYYRVVNNKTYVDVIKLSDYAEISGIKVPLTVEYDDGTKYKASVQFNVEYNEDIFVKPPPIEAGPEAWKPAQH